MHLHYCAALRCVVEMLASLLHVVHCVFVCTVQWTGHCVRSVALSDRRCHTTADAVASVFDAWTIIVLGLSHQHQFTPVYSMQQ